MLQTNFFKLLFYIWQGVFLLETVKIALVRDCGHQRVRHESIRKIDLDDGSVRLCQLLERLAQRLLYIAIGSKVNLFHFKVG